MPSSGEFMKRIKISLVFALLASTSYSSETHFNRHARDFKKNLKQEIYLFSIDEVRVIKQHVRIAGTAKTLVNNGTTTYPTDTIELELPLDSACKAIADNGIPSGKTLFIAGQGSAVRDKRDDGLNIGLINLKVIDTCELKAVQ